MNADSIAARRREAERRKLIYGVVFLALGGVVASLISMTMSGDFVKTVPVSVTLQNAGGSLNTGTDVKYRGLVIGKVASVRLADGSARLGLSIDQADVSMVPAWVTARVVPATAFGTTYVELLTPRIVRGHLSSGEVLAADRTTGTIELQQTLDGLDQVIRAVSPATLATLLSSLAQALDGHGAQYGAAMANIDHIVRSLNPKVPLIRTDMTLLAQNLVTIQHLAPSMLDALDNASALSDDLVKNKQYLAQMLAVGNRLVDAGSHLLTLTADPYAAMLNAYAVASDALYTYRSGLLAGSRTILRLGQLLPQVMYGHEVYVNAKFVNAGQFSPYGRADCPRYLWLPGKNCTGGGR